MLLEWLLISRLYEHDHLYQVLLTFGLILVFEELRSILFGDDVHSVAIPSLFSASLALTDTLSYPVYRLFISGVCLLLAGAMYLTLQKTQLGARIRAAASNPDMAQSLGLDIRWIHALVFAAGVALAAFAGMIAAPYVRTAHAKGLSDPVVMYRHALRNAAIPILTVLGPITAGLITGSFIIEQLFSVPGTGRLFVQSVNARDYGLIMGTTLFYAAIIVVANLVVDLMYAAADPRIRYR